MTRNAKFVTMKRHFLSVTDLSDKEIWQIFRLAKKLKIELKNKGSNKPVLQGKSLALVFEKQSLRTRISFEMGMAQFGGHTVYLDPRDTGIGVRESEEDVARVLSSMADVIAARTYAHETIQKIADNSSIPVINALSDIEHPCQALADLFTVWEIREMREIGEIGDFGKIKIAYVGDGENNVAHSLCLLSVMLGATFACASPKGYWMSSEILKRVQNDRKRNVFQTTDPKEAVKDSDVVVTDTWVSMGDTDAEKRMEVFSSYQVDQKLISLAKKDAIFMHCLPAYRGKEVTKEVIDGPKSVVFQEAENRLHVQKALLLFLLGKHKMW